MDESSDQVVEIRENNVEEEETVVRAEVTDEAELNIGKWGKVVVGRKERKGSRKPFMDWRMRF